MHLKQAAACPLQIGLLAALPMVAAKSWSWTDYARERFPDMDQLQRNRMDDLQPLLASMSLSQVLGARALGVVLSVPNCMAHRIALQCHKSPRPSMSGTHI